MWFWILVLGLILLYLVGPRGPKVDLKVDLPQLPDQLEELSQQIAHQEAMASLRPNTEARILWAHPERPQKTAYSLVYIHGFSASQGEGDPIHKEFAARYNCNLFFGRVQAHGTQSDTPLADLSPEGMLQSAAFALAVGQKIGEKVILMGTSTGCTLMMILAQQFPEIAGLICYSPNIAIRNSMAKYITGPWGKWLVRLVNRGGEIIEKPLVDNVYWDKRYHIKALVSLQALLKASMHADTFAAIEQPYFMGYYFKNEQEQDQTVSVPAMLAMYEQLGTPLPLKRKIPFPNAGDHAFPNQFYGKDLDAVRTATFAFAEEVLNLRPVN